METNTHSPVRRIVTRIVVSAALSAATIVTAATAASAQNWYR